MSADAAYDAEIHEEARRELDGVPHVEAQLLRDRIRAMARLPEPHTHRKAKELSGDEFEGLLSVRAGKWRALCYLDKPALRVVVVEKRKRVYDRIDAAQRRRSA